MQKVQYSNNDRLRNDRVKANKRRKFILAQMLNLSYFRNHYDYAIVHFFFESVTPML
jgi:hypothetical protein